LIDYKRLRRLDPATARQAVLDYLHAANGNVSAAARAFGINRTVVYDIQRRARDGVLADRSRAPHHRPTKTPKRIEDRVVAARNRTGLGYQRLARYLSQRGLDLPWSTVRNILQRNRGRLAPRLRPSQTGGYRKALFETAPRDPKEPPAGALSPKREAASEPEAFSPLSETPKPTKPTPGDFYSLRAIRRRLSTRRRSP
jgi:transposase